MKLSIFSSWFSIFPRSRIKRQPTERDTSLMPPMSAEHEQKSSQIGIPTPEPAVKAPDAEMSLASQHRVQNPPIANAESQIMRETQRTNPGAYATAEYEQQYEDLLDAMVMIVDDEPTTIEILQTFLEDTGYRHFVTTSQSTGAMELLEKENPAVVLTDLNMPDVTGFDILSAMRRHSEFQHIPAIVLTSSDDAETKLTALRLGATDFLSKPVDPSELALRLRNTLAAKAYQDRLASYDALTGLPNRRTFMDRLDMALQGTQRDNKIGDVLYLNLDRFKQINDTLGHSAGDTLLKTLSQQLEQCISSIYSLGIRDREHARDNLFRIGGDEFAVLLPKINLPMHADQVARRILEVLSRPIHLENHELFVIFSISIAVFPNDGQDSETLLKHVDIATHHTKQRGGNIYEFYTSEMNAQNLERLSLENHLRKALDRNELLLHYQPKVDIKTGQIIGAEALLRWRHPELGMISPSTFIPLAEDIGMIIPLGEWVLHTACQQNKAWQALGFRPLCIAVNVSSQQFRDSKFIRTIFRALASSGLAPQYLILELTENLIMENARENIEVLHKLTSTGVKLSVDDFGTGYSSLSYLQQFPLDALKIDRSFVSAIQAEADDAPIVTAIIAMAHSLGLTVTGEGVDNKHQLAFLRARDCDDYQGYLFSQPVTEDEFTTLLTQMAKN